jgi:hypothetical protein
MGANLNIDDKINNLSDEKFKLEEEFEYLVR